MAVNKVIYYGEVLVDMTQVSVNPDSLVEGETALDATGELINGANPYAKAATDEEVSDQAALLDQALTALQGKAAGGGTGGITPSGEIEITENGTYDVTNYASAVVNVEASGGGEDQLADLLTNKLTSLNSDVTSIREYAFRGATNLASVNLPNATTVQTNAFYGCSKLVSVNMPKMRNIASNAFNACGALPEIVLPSLEIGSSYMFRYCYKLATIDLAVITSIVANMFTDCRTLTALILRSSSMSTLAATSAFSNCYHLTGTTNSQYNPKGAKDCYIYVPAALVNSYKAASNWSTYSTQFRALEDYTVDGTTTGALDKSKI